MATTSVCDCGRRIEQAGRGRLRRKCLICSPERSGKPKAKILNLPSQAASPTATQAPPGEPQAPARPRRRLTDATMAELAAAGRQETTQGLAALHLAELIDAGGYTAQGATALIRAHREELALALAGAHADADVIDLIFGQEA